MSGALAERDFVRKLERVGFEGIEILDRHAWGIDDCEIYPLFDAELIALMRQVIPANLQDRVAESVVIKARLSA